MAKLMYQIKPTNEERSKLIKITTTGNAPAKEILQANVLRAIDDRHSPKLTVVTAANKCKRCVFTGEGGEHVTAG